MKTAGALLIGFGALLIYWIWIEAAPATSSAPSPSGPPESTGSVAPSPW